MQTYLTFWPYGIWYYVDCEGVLGQVFIARHRSAADLFRIVSGGDHSLNGYDEPEEVRRRIAFGVNVSELSLFELSRVKPFRRYPTTVAAEPFQSSVPGRFGHVEPEIKFEFKILFSFWHLSVELFVKVTAHFMSYNEI